VGGAISYLPRRDRSGGTAIFAFILRRLAQIVVVCFVISALTYLMLFTIGNPIAILLGSSIAVSQHQIDEVTRLYGLDRPFYVQYWRFVTRAVTTGDLGTSYYYGEPALRLILERMPATLLLSVPPLVIAGLLALPLGLLAALHRGRWIDQAILSFSMIGIATPVFWLAIILVYVFSVSLNVLPSSGYGTARHLVLPLVGITTSALAVLIRLVRTEVLETLSKEFVRTARAKGVPNGGVVARHVLRNSLIPFVTYLGLMAGSILGNTVITERIFAWPGSGRLLLTSIERLDYPVVLAFVILITLLFLVVNFLVDLLYVALDPRIRYG
jgi:peptide/nickel transport system permease protein